MIIKNQGCLYPVVHWISQNIVFAVRLDRETNRLPPLSGQQEKGSPDHDFHGDDFSVLVESSWRVCDAAAGRGTSE